MSFFSTDKIKSTLGIVGVLLLSSTLFFADNASFATSNNKAAKGTRVTAQQTTAVSAQPLVKASQAPIVPQAPWEKALQQGLQNLLEEDLLQRSQAGMLVYDLTADKIVFQHQPRQLLRPASTLKSLVAITAMENLSIYHQFTTKLAYEGSISNGVLTGNIYCIGGFDPLFDSSDMQAFVDSISALGIHTIQGSLIADVSMMDSPRWGIGWCWDDDEYNPPLFPLLVNGRDKFMQVFQSKLREAHIKPPVLVVRGQAPATAKQLCVRSHSMAQVLQPMLKDSDNLCAEATFYQLAAFERSSHATADDARKVVNRFIAKLGYNPANYNIADGCGLSLYDYLSSELEVGLLKYAYENKQLFNTFYPALPIGGVDGTLDYRMHNKATKGKIHAKTGTLTGVSALAGYTTTANGHLLAFSIMNNGILDTLEIQAWQDRVCEVFTTVE